MTAKEYLQQAWRLDQRIEARIAEKDRLMSQVQSARAPQLTGMPRGGKHDWTDAVDRAVDMSRAIDADIQRMIRLKYQIWQTIDRVEDARYRMVLELRYRSFYTWEEIASAMGYVVQHIYRLHGEALLKVRVPEDVME